MSYQISQAVLELVAYPSTLIVLYLLFPSD